MNKDRLAMLFKMGNKYVDIGRIDFGIIVSFIRRIEKIWYRTH